MNESETTGDSVYGLVNKLCHSIANGRGVVLHPADVQKLRALSFEILLKKRSTGNVAEGDTNADDPFNQLEVQIFAAKLKAAKVSYGRLVALKKLEAELAAITRDESFARDATSRGVLQVMLTLKGGQLSDSELPYMGPELLVPGPFTLHGPYRKSVYYPYGDNEFSQKLVPQYFKGIAELNSLNNPYVPQIEAPKAPRIDADLYKQGDVMNLKCSFTGLTARLCGYPGQPEAIEPPFMPAESQSTVAAGQPALICRQPTPQEEPPPRVRAFNWESLGYTSMAKPLPFAAEADVVLELMTLHARQRHKKPFEAKIVSYGQFLKDLKSLTVGIQSDTFKCDGLMVFRMEPHVTVPNVLPATIQNYVMDFVECGTCYKRLKCMIMKRDYQLMFEGFIFKALCGSIDEYLLTVRQFVFGCEDSYLMGYYKRVKKMMRQTVNLSITLGIHPSVPENEQPPLGSQFLGYLYREIVRSTDMDYITLLVFILRRCCRVYFQHLHQWLFYGLLDDPSSELFICFVDHYRPNTKYHYDKAYYVRGESVPRFLQHYEQAMLRCGKYTMLLKAFKPNHPLFSLKCPSMSVCVSFEEIEALQEECSEYRERALEVCGQPLTIRAMFETARQSKSQFLEMVSQKWRDNMDVWHEEQRVRVAEVAARKKKRLAELTQQLEDAQERKVAERRANVERELMYLREQQNLEDRRLLVDNINLHKRIEYYQELSDELQAETPQGPKEAGKGLQLEITGKAAPEETSQLLSPHTGSNNEDEDFESCNGDDDLASLEYLDCNSPKSAGVDSSPPGAKEAPIAVESEQKAQQTAKLAPKLVRSVSDIFNSNAEASSGITVPLEGAKNALSEAQLNKLKVLGHHFGGSLEAESTTGGMPPPPPKELTDAQRNKIRVMAHEYGQQLEEARTKSMPDINLNTLPDDQLTEFQRNQRRARQDMWSNEGPTDNATRKGALNLDLETDLQRNRRKVLESEFNIMTGSRTTRIRSPDTPMSTTSDTPLTEMGRSVGDAENGNLVESGSTATFTVEPPNPSNSPDTANSPDPEDEKPKSLKINVHLAQEASDASEEPATALTGEEPTPLTALNTAGLLAKQEFKFSPPKKCERPEAAEPLSWGFKKLGSKDAKAKRRALNTISVITLTDFLQKSVTIPMQTHLELVNNEVMRMFLEDLDIFAHLRSLRHYFLLMDGEFGSIICDGIIGKLEAGESPQQLLNYQMLHSILDTALDSSRGAADKNTENFSFIVSDVPDKFDLTSPTCLDILSLSYSVEWPLNLILNPETLAQYAKIFRYLLQVRRISWVLERAYQLLKEQVKTNGVAMLQSPQYRHVQLIRHKFYNFVHVLSNHITAGALEASWKQFKDDLLSAHCIEDIYRKHAAYVKRILFLCLLNRKSVDFYNNIENIFKISLRFYNNLKSRQFKLKKGGEHFTHGRYEKMTADEKEFDKLIKYTVYLGNKIVRHGYQREIGEFINLINYNRYYEGTG